MHTVGVMDCALASHDCMALLLCTMAWSYYYIVHYGMELLLCSALWLVALHRALAMRSCYALLLCALQLHSCVALLHCASSACAVTGSREGAGFNGGRHLNREAPRS